MWWRPSVETTRPHQLSQSRRRAIAKLLQPVDPVARHGRNTSAVHMYWLVNNLEAVVAGVLRQLLVKEGPNSY